MSATPETDRLGGLARRCPSALDSAAMGFPEYRGRRLRRDETLRRMVRETRLHRDNLIMPLFVVPGSKVSKPVSSMPGVAQLSVDRAVEECKEIRDLGIPAVI